MQSNTGIKVAEAAKMLDISIYQVKKLVRMGALIQVENSSPMRITEDSIAEYRSSAQSTIDPLGGGLPYIDGLSRKSFRLIDFRANFYRYDGDPSNLLTTGRYAVTEDGHVFNLITGREMSICSAAHEYPQVYLTGLKGRPVFLLLHRLVAFAWCDNGRFIATEVHHINGDIHNNRANNLIWLTHDEHVTADAMRKEAEESGDNRAYSEFMAIKRAENQYTDEQLARGIKWVFGEDNSSDYVDMYYVTDAAYRQILTGSKTLQGIDPEEIWLQFVNPNPRQKHRKTKERTNGQISKPENCGMS